MNNRPFRELSRRSRLWRFRELAHIALHAYGLPGAELTFLQYGENVIYRVDLRHKLNPGSTQDHYPFNRALLRLHAWNNVPYINSEMVWLDALTHQAGISAPEPIRTPNGDFVLEINSPNIPQRRCATLLKWLDGRKFQKGIRPVHLNALGQVIAQLHNFSASWEPPPGFSRPTWNWQSNLGGSLFDTSRDVIAESMPIDFQEPFEYVSQKAKSAMEFLGEDSDAFGLIHSDLYPENVLFKAGEAYPIDFEDCGFGYWIWDIAVALCTWAWQEGWEKMRDAFYDGYSEIRTLPGEQWEMLDLFIATQYATMLFWSSEFLLQDPQRSDEYIPWQAESGTNLLRYFEVCE